MIKTKNDKGLEVLLKYKKYIQSSHENLFDKNNKKILDDKIKSDLRAKSVYVDFDNLEHKNQFKDIIKYIVNDVNCVLGVKIDNIFDFKRYESIEETKKNIFKECLNENMNNVLLKISSNYYYQIMFENLTIQSFEIQKMTEDKEINFSKNEILKLKEMEINKVQSKFYDEYMKNKVNIMCLNFKDDWNYEDKLKMLEIGANTKNESYNDLMYSFNISDKFFMNNNKNIFLDIIKKTNNKGVDFLLRGNADLLGKINGDFKLDILNEIMSENYKLKNKYKIEKTMELYSKILSNFIDKDQTEIITIDKICNLNFYEFDFLLKRKNQSGNFLSKITKDNLKTYKNKICDLNLKYKFSLLIMLKANEVNNFDDKLIMIDKVKNYLIKVEKKYNSSKEKNITKEMLTEIDIIKEKIKEINIDEVIEHSLPIKGNIIKRRRI